MIETENNKDHIDTNLNEDEYLNSNNIERYSKNELLNHALHYAKIGYPVLPLHYVIINKKFKRCSCPYWKTCDKPGKHPRTRFGHKEATTDETIIKDWWTKCPNANIGILTGIETGIIVLDIDVNHGGEHSFEDLKDFYKYSLNNDYDCEGTLISYSGSGGRHLIYKHPMDYKITSSESKIDVGLDIKGEESYIVAAPSNHWSGKKYHWHGVNTSIADAPNWVMYEILEDSTEIVVTKSNSSVIPTERIGAGNRNSYLSSQARGLVNSFSELKGLEILLKKNREKLVEPLPQKEVERIVRKTWRKFGRNRFSELSLRK